MKALLIIDVQNDFLPGGALAVENAGEIIPIINALQKEFPFVIASKDWHPKGHISFASTHHKKERETVHLAYGEQVLWPDHCVQFSQGSDFPPSLETSRITYIVYKGADLLVDSYSAFFDQNRGPTGLADYLRSHEIDHLYVVGLVIEYCVKATVLDALSLGFTVTIIKKGCKGLDAMTSKKALAELQGPQCNIAE